MNENYRWFASHPLTGRIIGGEIKKDSPFAKRPEAFREWNCFVSVNPSASTPSLKARDTDVYRVHHLLVDLDPINNLPVPHGEHLAVTQSIRKHISDIFGYNPWCITNFSGRGIQSLISFCTLPVENNVDRYHWRHAAKCFLNELSSRFSGNPFGLRVDTCTSDLSRLCRAVYTINQDTKLESYHVDTAHGTLADPHAFMSLWPAAEKNIESPDARPHHKRWEMQFSHLSVAARRFISEGARYGERNDSAYKAAISCLDNGLSVEETRRALTKGNRFCVPFLDATELDTILSNAVRRIERQAQCP